MKGFVLKVGKFVTVMSAMLFFMFGCFDKGSDEKTTDGVTVKGTINVVAVDVHGNPLKDVRVVIGAKAATTDSDGRVSLADIDFAGASVATPVIYDMVCTKSGFANVETHANFVNDTVVDDETSSEIKLDPTGDVSIETEEGKVLVGKFIVTLKNGVANVKVVMPEIVTLKGTLVLPAGDKFSAGNVKIGPEITAGDKSVPKSDYSWEVTNVTVADGATEVNYQVKDVPIVTINEGQMGLYVYIDGKKYSEYYYRNDDIKYNLASKEISRVAGAQPSIDLGKANLNSFYSVTGAVYKDVVKSGKLGKNVIVELYDYLTNVKVAEANSDETGSYEFHEIMAGKYYFNMKRYDANGDGVYEYLNFNTQKFEPAVLGQNGDSSSSTKIVTRDLWFEKNLNYKLSGKVYLSNSGKVAAGVLVELKTVNGELIKDTMTDSNGAYSFTGVQYSDALLVSPGVDLDNNGVVNFSQAQKSVANEPGTDIVKDLFLPVNVEEPNYKIEIVGTNVGTINEGNIVAAKVLKKSDSIEISYKNAIAPEYQVKEFVLYENGVSVAINSVWNAEGTKVTITRVNAQLKADATYRLDQPALSTVNGISYGVISTAKTLFNEKIVKFAEAYVFPAVKPSVYVKAGYESYANNFYIDGDYSSAALYKVVTANGIDMGSSLYTYTKAAFEIQFAIDALNKDDLKEYRVYTAYKSISKNPDWKLSATIVATSVTSQEIVNGVKKAVVDLSSYDNLDNGADVYVVVVPVNVDGKMSDLPQFTDNTKVMKISDNVGNYLSANAFGLSGNMVGMTIQGFVKDTKMKSLTVTGVDSNIGAVTMSQNPIEDFLPYNFDTNGLLTFKLVPTFTGRLNFAADTGAGVVADAELVVGTVSGIYAGMKFTGNDLRTYEVVNVVEGSSTVKKLKVVCYEVVNGFNVDKAIKKGTVDITINASSDYLYNKNSIGNIGVLMVGAGGVTIKTASGVPVSVGDVIITNDNEESTVKAIKDNGSELEITLTTSIATTSATFRVENGLKITVDCIDGSGNSIQKGKQTISYDNVANKWKVGE